MARDYLTQTQNDHLANETVHSTCKIELKNSTVLYLATADLTIGGQSYLGTMKPTEPLRMSMTRRADKVSFEISNLDYVLGRSLVANETLFEGSFAIWGAWHKNAAGEWHDEKVSGEIVHAEIDGDAVYCKFKSCTEASEYKGILVASEFKGIPPRQHTLPPIDGIEGFRDPYFGARSKLGLFLDEPDYGRHYFPYEEEFSR